MSNRNRYLIVGLVILIGVMIDLITKSIFSRFLEYGLKDIELIPNLLKLTYIENDGAAYGMFGGKTWLLIVVTIIFIVGFVLYYIFSKNKNLLFTFSIGLIVSGAIGNLVDRLFFDGIVRDFISLRFFSFVFNFADMWITFGVICFAIFTILEIIKEHNDKKGKESSNDSKD